MSIMSVWGIPLGESFRLKMNGIQVMVQLDKIYNAIDKASSKHNSVISILAPAVSPVQP